MALPRRTPGSGGPSWRLAAAVGGLLSANLLSACGGRTTDDASSGTDPCPSIMELVVDVSSSMNDTPAGDRVAVPPEPSRWTLTRDALLTAVETLPANLAVGITFFPSVPEVRPEGMCIDTSGSSELAWLDEEQRALLEKDILGLETPRGPTPTLDALRFAHDKVQRSALEGRRSVVLLTDGAVSHGFDCKDGATDADKTALLATLETSLNELDIQTAAIGLPGSSGERTFLSRVATAGGTNSEACSDSGPVYCHTDLSEDLEFGPALAEALVHLCVEP